MTITSLDQKEWEGLYPEINESAGSWGCSIDQKTDYGLWKVVSTYNPKHHTRNGWFAIFTFLREVQEFPWIVTAAYLAAQKGVAPDEAWTVGSFFQISSGHSCLAASSYPNNCLAYVKQYHLKDRFKEINSRGSLNAVYALPKTGAAERPGGYVSIFKHLQQDDKLKEWVTLGWNKPSVDSALKRYLF